MDNDESPPEYATIASQYSKAQVVKRQDNASGDTDPVDLAAQVQKRKELSFKASHGLLLVFFSWLL